MTFRRLQLLACAGLLWANVANGRPEPCSDARPAVIAGFARTSCTASPDSVRVETYEGTAPLPPGATDFDKRIFVLARGAQAKAVAARAGIKSDAHRFVTQSRLLQPPQPNQVTSRQHLAAPRHHKGWSVSIEVVDYSTPGKTPGYAVMCATALRLRPSPAVAAQCFPFGEQQGFLKRLDAI